jgi:hypothetical protein
MKLSEFRIGDEFTTEEGAVRWRCTDVGTRVVVAIRVDRAARGGGTLTKDGFVPREVEVLDGAEAAAQGFFKGPPYHVAESVLDEYALAACEPVAG